MNPCKITTRIMDYPIDCEHIPSLSLASRITTSVIPRAFWILLSLGVVLRTRAYLTGRSLWHDEAALARNLVDRSFLDFTRPLDFNQGAPLGFLWVEKLLLLILGNRDYCLRLFPFLSGILALVLMLPLARRFTRGAGIPIAVALFTLSGAAIYYSSELKQYSSDAFTAVILLLAAYSSFGIRFSHRRCLVLALLGAVGLWLTHPAVFIVAGISLALLADLIARREWNGLPWLFGISAFWSANFLAMYWISLEQLISNSVLIQYWESSYPPAPFWLHPEWFADRLPLALQDILGIPALLGAGLWFLGGISMLRRTSLGLILIISPMGALAAAAVRSYPFYDRFLLFALPGVCICIGEGVESIRSRLGSLKPMLGAAVVVVLAGLLFYFPINQAWQTFRQPNLVEHLKPVLAFIQHSRRSDEPIYVYYGAQQAFIYYSEQFGFGEGDYVLGISSRNQPDRYLKQLEELKEKRVWLVFSHNCFWCQLDEQAFIINYLDTMGSRLAEIQAPKAAGYLYDLR
jgi:hypothetical protein